ncbi:carbohydrate sulfotransferase 11-like isoform X2 [Oculina patagonica]
MSSQLAIFFCSADVLNINKQYTVPFVYRSKLRVPSHGKLKTYKYTQETSSSQGTVMDRLSILLFVFFTFSFIVISYNVLYMERSNSRFNYKQGRNLTTDITEQNDKDLESIHRMRLNSTTSVMTQHASSVKSIQAMNLERQEAVREFCRKNNRIDEPVNTKDLDNIIVDEKLEILFCYIPKVSCSQWKTALAQLQSPEPKYYVHDARNFKFLHQYPPDQAKRMLKSYFKFVFVREPFERLLSAYLEKFHNGDPGFHKNYGRGIIERYRPGGNPEDKNVTFDEFVNYVINIGDGYWNEHWKTYDKLCYPCGVHYDFIGRFENLAEEARFVMSGISRKVNVLFPQVIPSSTSSKISFFYSKIPTETFHRVVRLFGDDSEMFGYDLPASLRARI